MSTDQWEAMMQAEDSDVRREGAEDGEPLFDQETVRVGKRSLTSSDLLDLRWSTGEGQLIPCQGRGDILTSISNLSWTFTGSLSVAGYERDDLVQESFLTLTRATSSFKGLSSLNTYADRVVRNGLLDLLDGSEAYTRLANSKTISLVLDGQVQESKQGVDVEVWDHEAVLLRASRSGWNPGMVEEDWVGELDDHALLALVDEIPDGLGAWSRMVEQEQWKAVADRMGVGTATAKRRVPVAWGQVLAIPEVALIITTASQGTSTRDPEIPARCTTCP
jgi:DNA-directed RNA polymerase specialized sigma24 family protein